MTTHFDELRFCCVPETPARRFDADVVPFRQRLLLTLDSKWVNGTVLNYYLFTSGKYRGSSRQYELVRKAFQEWKNIGIALEFKEVTNIAEAQVRIGFKNGDGSWSYVGRMILDKTVVKPNERTMNIGWDNEQTFHTCIHEIGHTLGFPHEHQNPISGIVWNEEAVYSDLGGPPNNWPRQQTYYNIIRKISPDEVQGSAWDPNSIMHYPFRAGLILKPEKYMTEPLIPTPGLSERDRYYVQLFYPLAEKVEPQELTLGAPLSLDLKDGEQVRFKVLPTETGTYSIRTEGVADTVMVLFSSAADGTLVQLAADDDSGGDKNALITYQLTEGLQYIVQVRLYWMDRDQQTAPTISLEMAT